MKYEQLQREDNVLTEKYNDLTGSYEAMEKLVNQKSLQLEQLNKILENQLDFNRKLGETHRGVYSYITVNNKEENDLFTEMMQDLSQERGEQIEEIL